MKSVIIGTAGHIDHGKTALVKALTGIDADRLEEEKRRGITIDLGFAHMELAAPGGETVRFGFVDVPGHERFVRNMLAGVGGIDLVLLVIAADESIKPQTREHFDICRLLGVRRGITVLTKRDLVDRETLNVVRLEVEEFLRGSFLGDSKALAGGPSIFPVSSLTGEGLDELKKALVTAAVEVPAKDSAALARLPIDRVFTMKGFGTVVTGTLIAGKIDKEQELEVLPAGRSVRVRGVQVHGQAAESALAGQRTALNLAGVATQDLSRGMMLAPPATFRTSKRIDVSLSLLSTARPLRDGARVHFHSYTSECIASVLLYGKKELSPGATDVCQLRLSHALPLLPGDRFIVRQFSPVITIGGGVVLDASPLERKAADNTAFLETMQDGVPEEVLSARIARQGSRGLSAADAVAETGWTPEQIRLVSAALLGKRAIVEAGTVYISAQAFSAARAGAIAVVNEFHQKNPLTPGMPREQLRERLDLAPEIFSAVLEAVAPEGSLEVLGELVRTRGRGVVMKDEEADSKRAIESAFASAALKVPALKDVLAGLKVDRSRAQKIVTLLLRDKILVKVSDELVFHQDALQELRRRLLAEKAKSPRIDVARFKDLTGVSRKYAIPLLEYLDRERVTKRVGDERLIL
jgi:selenocysteine-specific elongation factor